MEYKVNDNTHKGQKRVQWIKKVATICLFSRTFQDLHAVGTRTYKY